MDIKPTSDKAAEYVWFAQRCLDLKQHGTRAIQDGSVLVICKYTPKDATLIAMPSTGFAVHPRTDLYPNGINTKTKVPIGSADTYPLRDQDKGTMIIELSPLSAEKNPDNDNYGNIYWAATDESVYSWRCSPGIDLPIKVTDIITGSTFADDPETLTTDSLNTPFGPWVYQAGEVLYTFEQYGSTATKVLGVGEYKGTLLAIINVDYKGLKNPNGDTGDFYEQVMKLVGEKWEMVAYRISARAKTPTRFNSDGNITTSEEGSWSIDKDLNAVFTPYKPVESGKLTADPSGYVWDLKYAGSWSYAGATITQIGTDKTTISGNTPITATTKKPIKVMGVPVAFSVSCYGGKVLPVGGVPPYKFFDDAGKEVPEILCSLSDTPIYSACKPTTPTYQITDSCSNSISYRDGTVYISPAFSLSVLGDGGVGTNIVASDTKGLEVFYFLPSGITMVGSEITAFDGGVGCSYTVLASTCSDLFSSANTTAVTIQRPSNPTVNVGNLSADGAIQIGSTITISGGIAPYSVSASNITTTGSGDSYTVASVTCPGSGQVAKSIVSVTDSCGSSSSSITYKLFGGSWVFVSDTGAYSTPNYYLVRSLNGIPYQESNALAFTTQNGCSYLDSALLAALRSASGTTATYLEDIYVANVTASDSISPGCACEYYVTGGPFLGWNSKYIKNRRTTIYEWRCP